MNADPAWNLTPPTVAGNDERSGFREFLGRRLGSEFEDRVRAEVVRGGRLDEAGRRRLAEAHLRRAAEEYTRGATLAGLTAPGDTEVTAVVGDVLDDVYGLGRLGPLLDDQQVSAIYVDGPQGVFARYRSGDRMRYEPVATCDAELTELVRVLAIRAGIENPDFGPRSPKIGFTLPGGITVCAVFGLGERVSIAVRRPRRVSPTLTGMRRAGAVDVEMQGFLRAVVRTRHTILITGSSESGKTTLLAALADEIDPLERLVSIEHTPRLRLDADPDRHPDLVVLSTADPAVSGWSARPVSQPGEMVEWASRLDPDWLLLDDLQRSEIGPWAEALIRGVRRSITTMTALSPTSALHQITRHLADDCTTTVEEAAALLVAVVDFVVHLAPTPAGVPVVSAVHEVIDADGPHVISNEVYRPGPDRRAVPGVLPREDTLSGLVACGYEPDARRWTP